MDPQTLCDLNKSPFGRRLHILTHRLPRDCRAGSDWELDRGFHLGVLDDNLLEFTLNSRDQGQNGPTLPLLTQNATVHGQDRFLVWNCPGRYQPERFAHFAKELQERSDLQIGIILSQTSERSQVLLDFPKYRRVWKRTNKPVLHVFQDFPESGYFSVEKSLFDLGRIGRRLLKLSKIRRLLPW